MKDPELVLNEFGRGAFQLIENNEKLGEMVVAVESGRLIVYHTEVNPKEEGKGLAKILLNAMVSYARANQLKVIPLCPYVHAQFKRHPNEFEDIWEKDEEV
jgi:predicted GNAT family acetyltransferase